MAVVVELVLQQVWRFLKLLYPSLVSKYLSSNYFFSAKRLFDEPSYLSICCVLTYFVLSYAKVDGYRWRLIASACILLSQSFSGLIGLAWVVYRDDFLWKRCLKARAAIVLPVVSLGVFASPIFVGRLERIMEGVDGSTSHRVLGSLELTENILNQYPLAGIGLSQFKAWLSSRSFDLEHHFFMASLDTQVV